MSYVVQHGIVPVIQSLNKKDMENMPFSFKFNETTTSQVKKQYDAYITYFSKAKSYVVTTCYGSVFVGKCPAELLEHFNHFINGLMLERKLFLCCGMDGPSANKKFENSLEKDLVTKGTNLLSVDTCTLHIANNSFAELLKELKKVVDLDQLALDLHFFFKVRCFVLFLSNI